MVYHLVIAFIFISILFILIVVYIMIDIASKTTFPGRTKPAIEVDRTAGHDGFLILRFNAAQKLDDLILSVMTRDPFTRGNVRQQTVFGVHLVDVIPHAVAPCLIS